MKISYVLIFVLFVSITYGQNVGIGTASPGTKLDVNGAITLRETSVAVSSNAATIPSNVSQVRLTGVATATITLTAPAAPANAGQQIIIYNNTTGGYGATYAGTTIPDGVALEFIYTNGTWVSASNTSATSVSNTVSGNSLSTTVNGTTGATVTVPNIYTSDGTLAANRTVTMGGNVINFTGGSVGIGTASPISLLANTSTNTTGNEGSGIGIGGLTWATSGNGFAATFYNAGTTAISNGIAVKVNAGGSTGRLLDLSVGSALSWAGTSPASTSVMVALTSGNVGIGTSGPGTRLDVNGAITLREITLATSSNAATIPSNVSQVQLIGAATGTITLTPPTAPANAGQRLVIYNNTTGGYGATYAGTTIPDGVALEFIYTNGTWVATVPSGTSVSSITSASPLTTNTAATGAVTVNLTGIVPVANGGTGSSTQNWVDLTTNQTPAGNKSWSGIGAFTSGTASTSTTTGAVVVTGGEGISGALNVGGTETVTGLVTQNGGLTEVGAAAINNSGAATTNIGVSGTGAVSIGNATGKVFLPALATAGIVTNTATGQIGTTATIPIANGGTGSATQNWVDLTTTQTAAGAKTWSNTGTFTASGGGSASAIIANAAAPSHGWDANGQATDQKWWDMVASGTTFLARTVNDANSAATVWMQVNRGSGYTLGTVSFPNSGVGIGINPPVARLDVQGTTARSGTALSFTPSVYFTGTLSSGTTGPATGNIEFRHDNQTQGIGFGYQSIYATGSSSGATSQPLNILSQGTAAITLNAYPYGTGNVGIATTAPYTTLDVLGSIINSLHTSTNEHATTEQGSSYIGHQAGSNWGSDGFAGMHLIVAAGTNGCGNTGDVAIMTWECNTASQRDVMRITGRGNVGIGTSTPTVPLDVATAVSASTTTVTVANQYGYTEANGYEFVAVNGGSNTGYSGGSISPSISIRAQGGVLASQLFVISDERMKKQIGQSCSAEDLEALLKIKVTDYTMRDVAKNGNTLFKKVIAQQLREVYPLAVKTSPVSQFIPNIYQKAEGYTLNGNEIMINMPTLMSDTNIKIGSRCKFYMYDKEGKEKEMKGTLTAVSEKRLDITTGETINRGDFTGLIFVYGSEISDLQTVDYEAVSMLNVSATQELAKQLKAAQEKLQKLETENEQFKTENTQLRTSGNQQADMMKTMKAQIDAISERLNMYSSK